MAVTDKIGYIERNLVFMVFNQVKDQTSMLSYKDWLEY